MLCLHLKRFFINPDDGRMRKLTHRVVFPFELKVTMEAGDVQYDLFAVVVHVGGGIHHGMVCFCGCSCQSVCTIHYRAHPHTHTHYLQQVTM